MQCPRCGREMNHHADKVVEPLTNEERAMADAALGGVLKEAHACPGCGHAELRTVPPVRN